MLHFTLHAEHINPARVSAAQLRAATCQAKCRYIFISPEKLVVCLFMEARGMIMEERWSEKENEKRDKDRQHTKTERAIDTDTCLLAVDEATAVFGVVFLNASMLLQSPHRAWPIYSPSRPLFYFCHLWAMLLLIHMQISLLLFAASNLIENQKERETEAGAECNSEPPWRTKKTCLRGREDRKQWIWHIEEKITSSFVGTRGRQSVRDSPADSQSHFGVDWRRSEEMSRAEEEWSFLVLVRESSVTLRVSLKRRRRRRQGRMFLVSWERERHKHRERDREKRRGQADSNTGRAGLADDVLLTEVLMLQTIYEADSCFSADGIGKHRLPLTPHDVDMHNVNNSGDSFCKISVSLLYCDKKGLELVEFYPAGLQDLKCCKIVFVLLLYCLRRNF